MSVRGLVLFYTTGSCNGLNSEAFCVFDPTGANNDVSNLGGTCPVVPKTIADLTLEGVDVQSFPVLNDAAIPVMASSSSVVTPAITRARPIRSSASWSTAIMLPLLTWNTR